MQGVACRTRIAGFSTSNAAAFYLHTSLLALSSNLNNIQIFSSNAIVNIVTGETFSLPNDGKIGEINILNAYTL